MIVPDFVRRLFQSFLVDPLRRIDREQRDYMQTEASRRPDWKVAVVLVTAAFVLTLQHYFGRSSTIQILAIRYRYADPDSAGYSLFRFVFHPETSEIAPLLYWALFSFASYFFIPLLVIVALFRQSLTDYGCKLKGAFTDWWIYLVFFLVMGPLLFWVSTHQHFQETFPFYDLREGEALWPYFWVWEAAYFVQFIGLEFFFRGFMVHGTKRRFGIYSVFVMAVPYCMIHFGKPMLESLGAIVAGVVLGFMSLKNRSIWMGASLHMSVALSMDFLSLWRQGRLG